VAQVSRTTSQQGTENLAQTIKINYDDDEMSIITRTSHKIWTSLYRFEDDFRVGKVQVRQHIGLSQETADGL